MRKGVRTIVASLALAAAAAWVWPTIYRYEKIIVSQDTYLVRIHRITGHADILVPEEGWIPAEKRWDTGADGSPGDSPT